MGIFYAYGVMIKIKYYIYIYDYVHIVKMQFQIQVSQMMQITLAAILWIANVQYKLMMLKTAAMFELMAQVMFLLTEMAYVPQNTSFSSILHFLPSITKKFYWSILKEKLMPDLQYTDIEIQGI